MYSLRAARRRWRRLADDATGPAQCQELRDAFATLDNQLIVVTHHLALIYDFDRVVVDDGEIHADGVPFVALASYRRLMA